MLYILKIRRGLKVNKLTSRHLDNCVTCRQLFANMRESIESTALERAAMRMEFKGD